MPRKLPPGEEKFLRLYVKEGAIDEKIPVVEKRLRLRKGTGAKLLKFKRVQNALRETTEPIRLEQERQEMVGKAVDEVTAKLQAEKVELEARLAAATQMPAMVVAGNTDVIEQELMRLVRLDPERHGRIKLASIQTAFVVAGLMEQGTTRRVVPAEMQTPGNTTGIYQSLFDRMRAAPAAAPPTLPAADEAEVFDLTPSSAAHVSRETKGESSVQVQVPLEGEPIDPVVASTSRRQPSQKQASQVITVEVG